MPAIKNLIDEWLRRVASATRAHEEAARHYSHLNLKLGLPAAALSALTGILIFTMLGPHVASWLRISLCLTSLTVAALAGLQTLLRLSGRSEQHRLTGEAFGSVQRSLELARVRIQKGEVVTGPELEHFRDSMDRVSSGAPGLPGRLRSNLEDRDAMP